MKRLMLLLLALAATATLAAAAPNHARAINQGHEGQPINIAKFVVPGKINIFDFHSEYCPPCRAFAPKLEELAQKRPDVVVSEIDINRPNVVGIDWRSPVAAQYQLESIPHFVVYDAHGKRIAEGQKATEYVVNLMLKEKIIE